MMTSVRSSSKLRSGLRESPAVTYQVWVLRGAGDIIFICRLGTVLYNSRTKRSVPSGFPTSSHKHVPLPIHTMATSPELAHVQGVWDRMKPSSPIYRLLLGNIEITSASKGVVVARLKVEPVHLNSKGTLHGTVSACLTDWMGGMAIASTGLDRTGLSTDIHTSFVSTAKEGDWLEIEGRASKVGGTLAFTTVEIRKAVDGGGSAPVVCTGTHTKYVKQ